MNCHNFYYTIVWGAYYVLNDGAREGEELSNVKSRARPLFFALTFAAAFQKAFKVSRDRGITT